MMESKIGCRWNELDQGWLYVIPNSRCFFDRRPLSNNPGAACGCICGGTSQYGAPSYYAMSPTPTVIRSLSIDAELNLSMTSLADTRVCLASLFFLDTLLGFFVSWCLSTLSFLTTSYRSVLVLRLRFFRKRKSSCGDPEDDSQVDPSRCFLGPPLSAWPSSAIDLG